MNGPGRAPLRSAFRTHAGVVRAVNEDGYLDAPEMGVWLVADGMGGGTQGGMASHRLVEAMAAMTMTGDLAARTHQVAATLARVNGDLHAVAAAQGDGRLIATTVACLLGFEAGACRCLWAGDSRIYRWRRGALVRLTRDHSQVQELLEAKRIAPAEAAGHKLRNVITRAVGAAPELDLDETPADVEAGDLFLLCSDGLHTLVSDAELGRLLGEGSPDELARMLVHLAVSRGAPDNVTVGIVQP